MAKHYAVTPVLRPGAKSYSASFYNATGKRVTRGLRTRDLDGARAICNGLVVLFNAQIKSLTKVPSTVPLDAVRLYFTDDPAAGDREFGVELKEAATVEEHQDELNAAQQIERNEITSYPPEVRSYVRPLLYERYALKSELAELRIEKVSIERKWEKVTADYEKLSRTVMARIARAGEKAPDLAAAEAAFKAHIVTKTTHRAAGDHISGLRRFIVSLPAEIKNVADITAAHVAAFIDARVEEGDSTRKQSRRRMWRVRLSRFFSFVHQTYHLPSPMVDVPQATKSAVLRERGDIHWHKLKEIEAAIKAVPDRLHDILKSRKRTEKQLPEYDQVEYWRTLIATLGFAGLQLAELCWLRKSDVEFFKSGKTERARFYITTVADPEDAAMRHLLKTQHRKRHVDVHPDLLRRIKDQMRRAKGVFLFPQIKQRKKGRPVSGGGSERWLEQTLSTVLRGHPGAKDISRRPATPGLLPKGMNAKSLRRTFGSLLLRSGKSTAEVAAAMGNTEQVVRENYARILGREVGVDF